MLTITFEKVSRFQSTVQHCRDLIHAIFHHRIAFAGPSFPMGDHEVVNYFQLVQSTKYGLYRLSQTFAFVMVMEWHWKRGMTLNRNLCGILETFQDGFQDRWCPAKRKTSWPHLKISSCWSCLAFFLAIVGFQIWMLLYFLSTLSCYCCFGLVVAFAILVPKIKPLALSLRFSEFKNIW